MSAKIRPDHGNPSPSSKDKGNQKQKPPTEATGSAKGNSQGSNPSGATAKLSKEEKKRLKAERRVSHCCTLSKFVD